MPPQHLLSRHTVAKPIDVDQTVLCSPHELIAIVTHAHDVVVYRLNGQVAFTIKNSQDEDDIAGGEEPLRVTRMSWSPDGRRLAIAWNDGNWRIHEAEKGEAIFQGIVRSENDESDQTVVLGMAWAEYGEPVENSKTVPDFPRAVALLDITTVLPRLSSLPSHGLRSNAESTKFSNQAATDSVFVASTRQTQDGCVEVLLLYTSADQVHVMLSGTSHAGTAQCSKVAQDAVYASDLHTSYALDSSTLTLDMLKLPVQELSGTILHLTSHAATQLTALLQYIQRTTQCINHDFTTGLAQPSRFMKNISMTLDDNLASNSTLTSALMQLVMTGQFHADLLEWLTDIVKDTGLKRWDASVSTMYTSIETHLHEHLSPALDRMTIACTRLRGLARLYQGSEAFAPREELFTAILDAVDNTRLTIAKAIEVCITELSSWYTFAKWLKVQIEIASAGPNTKEAIETEERECFGIDFGVVLKYIRTVMGEGSALKQYVEGATDLRANVRAISSALDAAFAETTAWQGRLFSTTSTQQLSGQPGQVLSIYAGKSAITWLAERDDHHIVQSHVLSSNAGLATVKQELLSAGLLHAALYDEARYVLGLKQTQAADGSFNLASMQLSGSKAEAQTAFDHGLGAQVDKFMVSGRPGKEFIVVFDKGGRSWAVHDLQVVLKDAK